MAAILPLKMQKKQQQIQVVQFDNIAVFERFTNFS